MPLPLEGFERALLQQPLEPGRRGLQCLHLEMTYCLLLALRVPALRPSLQLTPPQDWQLHLRDLSELPQPNVPARRLPEFAAFSTEISQARAGKLRRVQGTCP